MPKTAKRKCIKIMQTGKILRAFGSTEKVESPFVEIERTLHGTRYYGEEGKLHITREGRQLIRELGVQYCKNILRGKIPLKETFLKSGNFGDVYKIEIGGRAFALKRYKSGGDVSESGFVQSRESAEKPVRELKSGKTRAVKSYVGSEKFHLMELLEAPTVEEVKTGKAGDELKDLYDKKVKGKPIEGYIDDSYFVLYDKQKGKFEFVKVDIGIGRR